VAGARDSFTSQITDMPLLSTFYEPLSKQLISVLGPHGHRDRPIPSRPLSPCILIQAHCAFGLCKASCHGPPAARALPHGGQGGRLRCPHDRGRQGGGGVQTPAYQAPRAPAGLPRRGQGEPPPVRPAGTLGAVASTPPAPPRSRPGRQDGVHLLWPATMPDIVFPRDGPDIRVVVCLPPQA